MTEEGAVTADSVRERLGGKRGPRNSAARLSPSTPGPAAGLVRPGHGEQDMRRSQRKGIALTSGTHLFEKGLIGGPQLSMTHAEGRGSLAQEGTGPD